MTQILVGGNAVQTAGDLPKVGEPAPDFTLTGVDLKDIKLSDFEGKRLLLNIFPSLDTGTCAMSVRQFNSKIAGLSNTVVLNVSRDLPFAYRRFCAAEGIENVTNGSEYKKDAFSSNYKVKFIDGPLAGLFSRSVVIINESGIVIYTEQVAEISQEPNYDAAMAALS